MSREEKHCKSLSTESVIIVSIYWVFSTLCVLIYFSPWLSSVDEVEDLWCTSLSHGQSLEVPWQYIFTIEGNTHPWSFLLSDIIGHTSCWRPFQSLRASSLAVFWLQGLLQNSLSCRALWWAGRQEADGGFTCCHLLGGVCITHLSKAQSLQTVTPGTLHFLEDLTFFALAALFLSW